MIYKCYKVYVKRLKDKNWGQIKSYDYHFNAIQCRKDLIPHFGRDRIKIEKVIREVKKT